MDDRILTGESTRNAGLNVYGEVFIGNTSVHEDQCAAYDRSDEPSIAPGFSKRPGHIKQITARRPRPGSTTRPSAPTPAARYAVGRYLTYAKADSDKLVQAAADSDLIALAEAGFDLTANLRELWRLRDVREETWAELVNVLQCVLAGRDFETLNQPECEAIRAYIADYLASGAVDDDLPLQARRLLRQAGLDPWRGLSAENQEDKR